LTKKERSKEEKRDKDEGNGLTVYSFEGAGE